MKRNPVLILSLLAIALTPALALAGNVRLGARAKQICVGSSAKLIQLGTQAEYWVANGKTSGQSTWSYRGNASTLTLDFATADAVAFCRKVGVDTYDIAWKLAYQDPNEYSMLYTVTCRICPAPPRPVPRAGGAQLRVNVGAARLALQRNDYGAFGVELHQAVQLASALAVRDRYFATAALKLRSIEQRLESRNTAILLRDLAEVDRMLEEAGGVANY